MRMFLMANQVTKMAYAVIWRVVYCRLAGAQSELK